MAFCFSFVLALHLFDDLSVISKKKTRGPRVPDRPVQLSIPAWEVMNMSLILEKNQTDRKKLVSAFVHLCTCGIIAMGA